MINLRSPRVLRCLALAGASLVVTIASGPVAANEAQTKHPASARYSGDSIVFFNGGTGSSTISGSISDVQEARRLRQGSEPLLYVRRDGVSYVIRDAALLRNVEDTFRPQQELGVRQGELGSRQGALGKKQAALAARYPAGGWSQKAAREHADIGRQQSELGRQQSVLGAEQARLGQQQVQLAREAQAKLRALVDDALRRGLAQKVD
jgi:hypothetical protein